mgnify:CR=1 FL=1
MSLNIKKRDTQLELISRLDSELEVARETDSKSSRINMMIRKGTQNHKGYSLSEELCLHRKKLLDLVDPEEWNDYVNFVASCIEETNNE